MLSAIRRLAINGLRGDSSASRIKKDHTSPKPTYGPLRSPWFNFRIVIHPRWRSFRGLPDFDEEYLPRPVTVGEDPAYHAVNWGLFSWQIRCVEGRTSVRYARQGPKSELPDRSFGNDLPAGRAAESI